MILAASVEDNTFSNPSAFALKSANMAARSGDTPMDFEYAQKGGQVDPNSAWIKNTGTRMNSFKSQNRRINTTT